MPKLGRPPKYPWRTMKVGEEFLFDQPSLRGARCAASQMNNEIGRTFIVRQVPGGVICRRIR